MGVNPFLGVILHAIGGFAAGTFYAPLRKVRRWGWESSWTVMAVAAWIVTPWLVARQTTPDLAGVLSDSDGKALALTFTFGVLWGIGGLTFGLTMRYLGMALGMAVALGLCATFGTLIPPIVRGRLGELAMTQSGQVVLVGIAVCIAGIVCCGLAGRRKEFEATEEEKRASIAEFALGKGFAVATVCGILSACFAFGLDAGKPIAAVAMARGTEAIFANNATLVVILVGGFLTNFVWCMGLNFQNKTFNDYVSGPWYGQAINYGLAILAGFVWYQQFFFYGMGTTKLGERYDFSSWTLHMAFIIIFSNLWGIVFKEWRGTSRTTKAMVAAGILTLIASTVIIGVGNNMAQ